MRKKITILVILTCLISCGGCSGQFCAIGTSSTGSTTHVGCLSAVQGKKVEGGRAVGDKENLLYLMIICSGVKAAPDQSTGGGIEGDPMSKPEISYQWGTTAGTARVTINWDTGSGVVAIGDQKFDRAKGNTFFIERTPDGKLSAKQCGILGPAASFSEVADRIRQTLPDNEVVRTAKFSEVDKMAEP
jgi:hypothetical protein